MKTGTNVAPIKRSGGMARQTVSDMTAIGALISPAANNAFLYGAGSFVRAAYSRSA
jgi:hypothetical protein